MSPEAALAALARRHPRLWHLTDAANLCSIERHGLLSTSALLDLHRVHGPERTALEQTRRPHAVTLHHPAEGTAALRDNRPSLDTVLARCLVGLTLAEWYATLNARVFFWASRTRALRLAAARAHRDRDQRLLAFDTAGLLAPRAGVVSVSHMNTGATHPLAAIPRGAGTFRPLAALTAGDLAPAARPIVEVTVDRAVPDALAHLVAVTIPSTAARMSATSVRSV